MFLPARTCRQNINHYKWRRGSEDKTASGERVQNPDMCLWARHRHGSGKVT